MLSFSLCAVPLTITHTHTRAECTSRKGSFAWTLFSFAFCIIEISVFAEYVIPKTPKCESVFRLKLILSAKGNGIYKSGGELSLSNVMMLLHPYMYLKWEMIPENPWWHERNMQHDTERPCHVSDWVWKMGRFTESCNALTFEPLEVYSPLSCSIIKLIFCKNKHSSKHKLQRCLTGPEKKHAEYIQMCHVNTSGENIF